MTLFFVGLVVGFVVGKFTSHKGNEHTAPPSYKVTADHLNGYTLPSPDSLVSFKDDGSGRVKDVVPRGYSISSIFDTDPNAGIHGPAVKIGRTWFDARTFWAGIKTINGMKVEIQSENKEG